jgi:hypothetical protein
MARHFSGCFVRQRKCRAREVLKFCPAVVELKRGKIVHSHKVEVTVSAGNFIVPVIDFTLRTTIFSEGAQPCLC